MKTDGIHNIHTEHDEEDMKIEGIHNDTRKTEELTKVEKNMEIDRLVFSLLITLAVILGVIIVANIYTIGQTLNAVLFSQRTHLQRAVAKHDLVQSEGGPMCDEYFNHFSTCRLSSGCQEGG